MTRFAYYDRLSRKDQAVYRQSDALVDEPVSQARALRALLPPIEAGLRDDDRGVVHAATRAFVSALLVDVGAPPVLVKILAKRPADGGGELHGLYVAEEGEQPILRVWMRTAAHKRPVAYRTFVRTVLHEVCHHLDFTIHEWPQSFHTQGFFKRENHLARQLLGPSKPRAAKPAVVDDDPPPPAKPGQLGFTF